jgi:hypothetical protein
MAITFIAGLLVRVWRARIVLATADGLGMATI